MEEKYDLVATAGEVETVITRIAREIASNHPESPLFIALLRGAAPFASKLMFELVRQSPHYNPELDYMMISTYGADHTAKQPVVVTDLAPTTIVANRPVIVLDDVIDLGITSDFVRELLLGRGANSVELAVLAAKDVPSRIAQADYVGFDAGDKWLVGMGLDDAHAGHEAYRWIDSVWEIKR